MARNPVDEHLARQAEDAGLNASAPPQQLWIDGWLVRLSPGKAKRARCINALAPGRQPLEDKLRECGVLYREAGLPMIIRLTPFSEPRGLDAELSQRGWERFDDSRVLVLPELAALAATGTTGESPDALGLSVLRADPAGFAETIGRLRESPPEQIREHARRLESSPVAFEARIWCDGERVVACGQIARQGHWVGLYDIAVVEAQRKRGVGRALCLSLLRDALGAGATAAYLQVDASNAPARALYQRLGFSDAFGYHYRSPEPLAA